MPLRSSDPIHNIPPFTPTGVHISLNEPLFSHLRGISPSDLEILSHSEEYLSGRKKHELSHWWLQYIEDSVDKYLVARGYDTTVVPYNYLDHPPSSLQKLQGNLQIARGFLDDIRKGTAGATIQNLVDPLKNEIYMHIDKLHYALKLVVWDQLNNHVKIARNHKRELAFIEEAFLQFNAMRTTIPQKEAAGIQECINDLVYLNEMRRLDDHFFTSLQLQQQQIQHLQQLQQQQQQYATPPQQQQQQQQQQQHNNTQGNSNGSNNGPSDIVPVTGLIVNRLHRLENELKTVHDHWRGRM
jgi:hypothetical protein